MIFLSRQARDKCRKSTQKESRVLQEDKRAKLQKDLAGMVDLEQTVVVTGFGEVGPYGNARTRWEMVRESPRFVYCCAAWFCLLSSAFCLLLSLCCVVCRVVCCVVCRLSSASTSAVSSVACILCVCILRLLMFLLFVLSFLTRVPCLGNMLVGVYG
jgi:hypothetical protein